MIFDARFLCGWAKPRIGLWLLLAAWCLVAREVRGTDLAHPAAPVQADEREAGAERKLARARLIVRSAEPLFAAGHYEAALVEYTRAYEVLRGHPRQYWVLHNLAACNERLFRYDLALGLYEEYLRRAPASEQDRPDVMAVINTLRSLLGTLVVESAGSGTEVWIGDRRLGPAPGRWLVPKGRHVVEVRAALHEPQRFELQLGAAQTRTLRPELRRLSTYRGPSRVYFWTAAVAGGAALAAGATLGVLALSSRDEGEDRASVRLDTSEQSEHTRQLALAADLCFGGALLFGATASVLYFVTDWSDTPPLAASAARSKTVARLALEPSGGARAELALEFQ